MHLVVEAWGSHQEIMNGQTKENKIGHRDRLPPVKGSSVDGGESRDITLYGKTFVKKHSVDNSYESDLKDSQSSNSADSDDDSPDTDDDNQNREHQVQHRPQNHLHSYIGGLKCRVIPT